MNTSFNIATTGIRSYQGKLDTIANNIANVDKTGFKRREATFSENLAVSIQNQSKPGRELGRTSPNGIRTTYGSRIGSTALDITQGGSNQTDNPYDLMLIGNGYFQVLRTTGDNQEIHYTKNGSFHSTPVGTDRFQLVNDHGDVLLDRNGNPIESPIAGSFQVSENGTIASTGQQIGIVTISNPQLLKEEGGVYRLQGGAATTMNQNFQIKQGYIETSNVQLNKEMTEMIKAQRGLQASSRALSYADQMMGIANSIIRS